DESTYQQADITRKEDLERIMADPGDRLAMYFAVPPAVAASACDALADVKIPEGTVLALEKPFGVDQAGARDLNDRLARLVPESQVFRVDHFLGRSTTLNVLGVRFANRVIASVWSAQEIESVVIRYDETLGLEGRAGYYDHAGALVDMIQSHLLQVMAVVAMEPPATLHERDFPRRDHGRPAREPASGRTTLPRHRAVRGTTAGEVAGRALPSYVDEPGRGSRPRHRDARRGRLRGAQRTMGRRALPAALGQGARRQGRGDRGDVPEGQPRSRRPRGGRLPVRCCASHWGPDHMDVELNVNGGDDPFELERATIAPTSAKAR
ncbi:glucose-6-phosphate dehydrogenase-like protein, partial [Microbacterium kyungheense]